MIGKASLMKAEFVLEIARKDERFLNDISKDPVRTLAQSGIDLSQGEVLAIIDVIHNTSHSLLAPQLQPLRDKWGSVLGDAKLK